MIKLICIIAILFISGCSSSTVDNNLTPETDNVCISEVFTEDKTCVISDFTRIRVDGIIENAYDVSKKSIESNSEELIALSIDLAKKKIEMKSKLKGNELGKWNLDNLNFTPYLYYEFAEFTGILIDISDDLDNHGISYASIIDQKYLTGQFIRGYSLKFYGHVATDSESYKAETERGSGMYSRKGNVINLTEVLYY